MVSALAAGVSREGQKLYMAITKTISEVNWNGPNIVVFNDVVITPPYNVENVTGAPGSQKLTYVKKIVEKHTSSSSSNNTTSSSSTSTSGGSDSLLSASVGSEESSQSSTVVSKNSF